MVSSKTVAGTAFRDFDVFVCAFCFCGLRFVDMFDHVTGVMDAEKSRYTRHSEHDSRLIIGA